MIGKHLRTIEEVAAQVKRAPYTVREWAKRREHLPFVRIGRRVYADQADIDRFLEQQTQAPVTAAGRITTRPER
jgi:excisionase family DNA binding protein